MRGGGGWGARCGAVRCPPPPSPGGASANRRSDMEHRLGTDLGRGLSKPSFPCCCLFGCVFVLAIYVVCSFVCLRVSRFFCSGACFVCLCFCFCHSLFICAWLIVFSVTFVCVSVVGFVCLFVCVCFVVVCMLRLCSFVQLLSLKSLWLSS